MDKGTILLVDDDDGIRDALEQILVDEGYQCVMAADGEEGLDAYLQSQPDLILLDLMMPRMDGWQFMDQLRSLPGGGEVPVIVISADRNVREKAAKLEVEDFMAKPFDLDELLHKVENKINLKGESA